MLKEGMLAPNFKLMGDDNQVHSLSQHQGKVVILYFYPKDDTPGCTKEACDFRDVMNKLITKNIVVYGVSKDSIASHVKFKTKFGLNFILLSDPELESHETYGAAEEGRTIRSTFLIDSEGHIVKMWSPVRVPGHVEEILEALKKVGK